jgi:hypothetical protein
MAGAGGSLGGGEHHVTLNQGQVNHFQMVSGSEASCVPLGDAPPMVDNCHFIIAQFRQCPHYSQICNETPK